MRVGQLGDAMRALAALAVLVACDGEDPADAGRDAGTGMDAAARDAGGGGGGLCAALEAYANRCEATSCERSMISGCAQLEARLSPAFVAALVGCLDDDTPQNCMVASLGGLEPAPAHESFASAYCAGCEASDATCASGFFDSERSALAVALASSEATTAELESRCASGVLCRERIGECARDTYAMLGVPMASAQCVFDALLSVEATPRGCAEGGPTDAGAPDGGAPDAAMMVDGGGLPPDCLVREPDDDRPSASPLGDIDDRSTFPSGNVSGGVDPGDEDWFRYHDADLFRGVLQPRVDLVIRGAEDLDLCVYFACDSAGASTVSCPVGETASLGGLDGCCSRGFSTTETVEISPDCTGSDDSGDVYVRIYEGASVSACQAYFLAYGDD
ncbi:MAG: hypothetical protein AB7S26_21210 [Sandaracinaceae bacterium]